LEEIVAAPVKKTETNDRGGPLRWPRNTLCPLKLALRRQQAAVARSDSSLADQSQEVFFKTMIALSPRHAFRLDFIICHKGCWRKPEGIGTEWDTTFRFMLLVII
jgi:hypothetical protein